MWRLDRLGRSLRHLIDTVTELNSRGVGFKSLQENIDTTTSGGKFIFHIFGSLAEFEREINRERTNAGLKAARSRGRVGGRPKALTAGCVDTDLPVGRCYYARSDKSVGESACLHHAMWVDHTETCCTDKQVQMLKKLAEEKESPVNEICRTFGISRKTYYRYVKAEEKS